MGSPRLAHVVLGLPFGGTEILVERMLRNPPTGFAASCLCLDLVGAVGERAVRDGVPLTLMRRRPGIDFSLPYRLARHAAAHGIDIFHCHQYTPFFYGVSAGFLNPRLKIVFTEHGRFHPDLPSPKRRIFNRFAQMRASAITAVSPAVKKALEEVEGFSPDRVEVVFNGISFPKRTADKTALRAKLNLPAEGFVFILCSRFDPIKWIPGLLRAFRKAADANPGVLLALVGDGPEKEAILAERSRLGLENQVVMPGFQGEVSDWLYASDAFVLSSLNEGTSVSLIESMAAGLPSVVTRVGGNPHVVEEGKTGFLTPSEDEAALAQAMLALAGGGASTAAMGMAARRRYEERFLPEQMDNRYGEIYRRALGQS